MKSNFAYVFMLALLASLFVFPSCKKEGPQGPPGKDGIDGINGTNGINGANGEDGNANMQLFLFETGNTFTSPIYNKAYTLNGVTNDLVDSSLVLVYATDETDSWIQVGTTNTSRTFSTRWYYIKGFGGSTTGSFYVDIESPAGGAEYVSAPVGQAVTLGKVKFIIAPSNIFSGKKEPVDFADYEHTMLHFGLRP